MSQTRMEIAYAKLRDKVWSGDLKPGDRLVNRTLGMELGVSTVTVREAIHRLANDGVVEHVPNAGAYVRKLSAKETVDLFSFRAWIDLFTAREAVRKIDENQLHRLEFYNGQMREIIVALRDMSRRVLEGELMQHWLEIDRRFHKSLCEAAHNNWLIKATEDIQLLWHVIRAKVPMCSFSDACWTYRQHCEITRALKDRDELRLNEWVRIHGDQSLASMLNDLEAIGEHENAMTALGGRSFGQGVRIKNRVPRGEKDGKEL